ncbi:hypothetical protein ACFX2B_043175 [Malus domestica]
MRRLWVSWAAGMLGGKRDLPCLLKRCRLRIKPKTSFARAGSPTASRLVIDLTFSKGTKNEAAKFEHVVPAMSRMASTIADMIVRHKGHVMPLVLNFVPRRLLGAKSGSPLERLTIMKSDKVDSTAKVAPRPIPYAAETDSPAGNEETACVGSCEKSHYACFWGGC